MRLFHYFRPLRRGSLNKGQNKPSGNAMKKTLTFGILFCFAFISLFGSSPCSGEEHATTKVQVLGTQDHCYCPDYSNIPVLTPTVHALVAAPYPLTEAVPLLNFVNQSSLVRFVGTGSGRDSPCLPQFLPGQAQGLRSPPR